MLINTDFIYPIGSIYISVEATNPSKWFGGTWQSFGSGRTLVGVDTSQTEFNTVQKTGGSKYSEKHKHDVRWGSASGRGVSITASGSGLDVLNVSTGWEWTKNTSNEIGSGANLITSEVGTGNSGNLQPYITVYMWRRTT